MMVFFGLPAGQDQQGERHMNRYLIEVPHGADQGSCEAAIRIFLESGSHFMTHAEWGCKDGEHKGWIILEVEDKAAAREILPPAFRKQARITLLNRFTFNDQDELVEMEEYHQGKIPHQSPA
jgi:hypothetical protein